MKLNIDETLDYEIMRQRATLALKDQMVELEKVKQESEARKKRERRVADILRMREGAQENITNLLTKGNTNTHFREVVTNLFVRSGSRRSRLKFKTVPNKKSAVGEEIPGLGSGWKSQEKVNAADLVLWLAREGNRDQEEGVEEKEVIIALTIQLKDNTDRELGQDVSMAEVEILNSCHDFSVAHHWFDTCVFYEDDYLDDVLVKQLAEPESLISFLVESHGLHKQDIHKK